MKAATTHRGFVVVTHPQYLAPHEEERLIQESSAIGDCPSPGGSFLWIGDDHHLNRDEVAELVSRMVTWLATGRLVDDSDNAEIEKLREEEWDYDSLVRILRDELPLTMTLGLVAILVERMALERMFAERFDGVVAAVQGIVDRAAEAAGEE